MNDAEIGINYLSLNDGQSCIGGTVMVHCHHQIIAFSSIPVNIPNAVALYQIPGKKSSSTVVTETLHTTVRDRKKISLRGIPD